MTLSSLVAAAQSAVEMSQAAAAAAEDAVVAAKLARVHAQAALAAAKLALELDQKLKIENDENLNDSREPPQNQSNGVEESELEEIAEGYRSLGGNPDESENESKSREIVEDGKKEKKQFCGNCRLHKSACLNGKFLLKVSERTRGMYFKTTGRSWADFKLDRLCVVESGDSFSARIRWVSSYGNKTGAVETYPLSTNKDFAFKFYCDPDISTTKKEIISSNVSNDRKTNPSTSHFVHRLTLRKTEKESLIHKSRGEKHRIKFCASEDITLTGLGFLVAKDIDRVTITASHQLGLQSDYSVIRTSEVFWNVRCSTSTVLLKLRKPLPLSCHKIYLLTVTLHGGASIVGHGGEEFISVARGGDKGDVLFKFDNYRSQSNVQGISDVEKGVIEKIYFAI